MTTRIAVLGGGPGGYAAALKAAMLGARTTLIEKENLGGTCLNWGCIPSKIMKTSADLMDKFKKAGDFGINVTGDIACDMAALMQKKEQVLDTQRKGIASLLQKRGVTLEKGTGVIKNEGAVTVHLNEGGEKEVPFDRLIVATGTKPLNIDAFPFDHESILSSNDLLCLEKVPERITIVGGGVIGCEFAFILSSLGSAVTVVEAMSRILPLPSVDESCSKLLQREMKKRKIKVLTDTVVEQAEKKGSTLSLKLGASPFTEKTPAGKKGQNVLETGTMAVCIGRSPLSKAIGLENTGVETNDRGWIKADDRMKTSADHIFAIGDILGPDRTMLAHVASHEGFVAADNAMGLDTRMDYGAVPNAIFTSPEVGNVGLTETGAKEKGIDAESTSVNFRVLGKAQAKGEIAGEAKIITEKETGKIVGVHVTGPHATDIIAEGTLAVKNGLTVNDLAETIHAHPTLAEIMLETSLKAAGTPLHG